MNCFINRTNLLKLLNANVSKIHSNAALVENCENINNRNPRNLELLRIARKPSGYHLEKPGRDYWHRFVLVRTSKYITLEIQHFLNGTVVSASSNEWAIKKRLYRTQDSATYLNLGRILAQRCVESGIMFVKNNYQAEHCPKLNLALEELSKGGVVLTEPDRYINPAPWDTHREDKPWEVPEQ